MKKENKNKKWKVEFSNEVLNKFEEMPDDVAEELEKLIKGFKNGKIDPTKIGTPVKWKKLKIRLICQKCKSEDVEWLLDKNSNEVTFNCLKCRDSFWMTYEEYKRAIDKNTDCIIK